MIVSRIQLENWRNFRTIDLALADRVFVVGPNASGKSNFLDAFRFIRDIVRPYGGGLQQAIMDRGGVSKIRCLSARAKSDILLEVELSSSREGGSSWRYSIGIRQQSSGRHLPLLSHEKVVKDGEVILDRPDADDRNDELRMTQTSLESISANARFREIADFFGKSLYFHLIPQLLQHPDSFAPSLEAGDDPYGRNLLNRIGSTKKDVQKRRMKKISEIVGIAVPQLSNIEFVSDEKEGGVPHLQALYQHWRPHGAKQREDQFSDGTLRLIALLWSILDSDSIVLFEEPELSLHPGIVKRLPEMMYRLTRKKKKRNQIILSTHSAELLSDSSIGGEEVVMLEPGPEGTNARIASGDEEIRTLLESGLTVADTVIPRTEPANAHQLSLFGE